MIESKQAQVHMKFTYLAVKLVFSGLLQAAVRSVNGLWVTDDDPENGSGLMDNHPKRDYGCQYIYLRPTGQQCLVSGCQRL